MWGRIVLQVALLMMMMIMVMMMVIVVIIKLARLSASASPAEAAPKESRNCAARARLAGWCVSTHGCK